ncbi:hypothetical protein [Pikeienuella sp. HZG-20]|uniref:hypothetical protein n=1 Tax=Paludibacillus litoralis TaxID=3133267 RepID=UPI0030ED113F
MNLQKFSLIDDCFVDAVILTLAGAIRVEAEIMVAGLPAHIDSATWVETGQDAAAFISPQLDEVRELIQNAAIRVLA